MELMLEIERAGGARSWHRVEGAALTLGRALANEVIVDDPYLEGRHAEVTRGDDGTWYLHDLGSTNGVWMGATRVQGPLALVPGQELRLGHTIVRVRDRHEGVAPALVDRPAAPAPRVAAASAAGEPALARWLGEQKGGRYVLAAIVLFALNTWLGSSSQSAASELFTMGSGVWLLLSVWAGAWAIFSRIVVQRFYYNGHLVIAATSAVAALALLALGGWLEFLAPGSSLPGALSAGLGIVYVAATVCAHLGLATHLPRERLVRTATGLGLGMLLLFGVSEAIDDREYTFMPSYVASLKPVTPGVVPAVPVEAFTATLDDLQAEVDRLARDGERPPSFSLDP